MMWPFGNLRTFHYGLIMADPPWDFRTYSQEGQKKGPASHYSVMSIDEIKALPVGHLAAGDCVLWLSLRYQRGVGEAHHQRQAQLRDRIPPALRLRTLPDRH